MGEQRKGLGDEPLSTGDKGVRGQIPGAEETFTVFPPKIRIFMHTLSEISA